MGNFTKIENTHENLENSRSQSSRLKRLWDELCINCKKNTRNSGDLIDYMERLITKVDSLTKDVNSLAKEVDDIKKAIRIPV